MMRGKEQREFVTELSPGLHVIHELLQARGETTDDGRLLLEYQAPEDAIGRVIAAGIPMQVVPSRFTDSHAGEMVLEPAMKEIRSNWEEITRGLTWINQQYFDGHSPRTITGNDAFVLSTIGVELPLFLLNRAETPYDGNGQIPAFVGGIFKIAQGMRATAGAVNAIAPNTVIDNPAMMYEIANAHGRLVRELACPAPKTLITAAAKALFLPDATDASQSPLQAMIPDFEKLKNFATSHSASFAEVRRFQLGIEDLFEKLQSVLGANHIPSQNKDVREIVSTYFVRETFLLGRLRDLQDDMNFNLGRFPYTAPEVTREDIRLLLPDYQSELRLIRQIGQLLP